MKEYKALQKKMKELEIENEILKKATAIFAKNRTISKCRANVNELFRRIRATI